MIHSDDLQNVGYWAEKLVDNKVSIHFKFSSNLQPEDADHFTALVS